MQIFAEEYPLVKIAEYEQNPESGMFIRPYQNIAPQDDYSNDYLFIGENGEFFIYQVDNSFILRINNDYILTKEADLNLWRWTYDTKYYKTVLKINDKSGRIYLYNKRYEMFAYVETFDLFNTDSSSLWLSECYYDEQCDVLFFRDSKSNLYSIEHPSMDEAENKANFKGPTETIEMLNSGKYAPHLTAKNNKSLCIDQSDKSYYWDGKRINGHRYQLFNENTIYYWPNSTLEGMIEFNLYVPYGDVESIAIHPCGDLYMLGINWNTNTHILYRIENTWDPEWRASWYAAHPDAPGQELPSGNGAQAAAPKVRTGYLNDDRIRLRKGPGTGTDSLGTYSINTTFTILENSGVKQTIDGVTSEWIKVRLNDGTEGYFYGQYVSEK